MAVTYSATVKGDRMQQVIDRTVGKTPAAGTGSATAGNLVIGDSSLSGATGVLVTIPLTTTAFTLAGAVLTLHGLPLSAVAAAAGTAAKAEIRNNAGTVIVSGLTVGTSGTDIILGTTTVTIGLTVIVTAGTITHG
jgi:hypothetical protein